MSTITSQDLGAWRQPFRLTHTFHLCSGADDSIAGQLESALKQARAQIDKWLIVRRAGRYEHSITIEGIGEESARELRKEFASLGSDIKVHVEHLLHFERDAAAY
jgi:hypothetical protein